MAVCIINSLHIKIKNAMISVWCLYGKADTFNAYNKRQKDASVPFKHVRKLAT